VEEEETQSQEKNWSYSVIRLQLADIWFDPTLCFNVKEQFYAERTGVSLFNR
jgi:hypothetical protein